MGRIQRSRGRAYVVLAAAILGAALVISAALLRSSDSGDATAPPGAVTPQEGLLLVTSEPDGALVWIDGEERGITPLRVRGLAEGRHRVHLEKEGFTPLASGEAEFEFGAEKTFHGVLSAVTIAEAMADDRPAPAVVERAVRDVVETAPDEPFRAPRIRKPVPATAKSNAVDLALEWLAAHQSEDGRWDADGFGAHCEGDGCGGTGRASHDVGVTALSVLAFLGAGETHNVGTHRDTVKDALRYLKGVQDDQGCFGPKSDQMWMYDHLAATLAMTEAYGLTGSRLFKQSAQSGVDFVLKAQNPYMAWRYGVRDGDNDTSVTAWAVMVLKSAQMAELDVDPAAFQGALNWVEKMTEPEFGRVGYQQRGGRPARMQDMMERFPAEQVETLTAMGVLTRIFCGQDLAKSDLIQKGADLLVDQPPRWTGDSGSTDFTYWWFGTMALHQVGGRHWKEWREDMIAALVPQQHVTEGAHERGSWDPVDPWSGVGGRVYATALNCLTLERMFYGGYQRVFDDK